MNRIFFAIALLVVLPLFFGSKAVAQNTVNGASESPKQLSVVRSIELEKTSVWRALAEWARQANINLTNMLFGNVQNSQSLAPLAPELRAGVQSNTVKLTEQKQYNYWYRVPAWWAGTWRTETNTTFYTHKYKSDSWANYLPIVGLGPQQNSGNWQLNMVMDRGDTMCGFQRDKSGQIWQFGYSNFSSCMLEESYCALDFITEHDPLEITDSKVVERFVSTQFLVSKKTRLIGAVSQFESILTYTPAGKNLVKCVYSVKQFDRDGQPEALTEGVAMRLRVMPFKPWNHYDGRDMVALFSENLKARGLADLIPLRSAIHPSQHRRK
jgi:hypothetical protein